MLRWTHSKSWLQLWIQNIKGKKGTRLHPPLFNTFIMAGRADLAGIRSGSDVSSATHKPCDHGWVSQPHHPHSFHFCVDAPPSPCCYHKGKCLVQLPASVRASACADWPWLPPRSQNRIAGKHMVLFLLPSCFIPLTPSPLPHIQVSFQILQSKALDLRVWATYSLRTFLRRLQMANETSPFWLCVSPACRRWKQTLANL